MTSVIWPTLVMPPLPEVLELPDPYDNYLLAITRTGAANYLVSGDKRDLVSLNKHEGTTIVTVGHLLNLHTQKSMSIDAVRQLHGDAHMKHKDKLEVVSGSGNVLRS